MNSFYRRLAGTPPLKLALAAKQLRSKLPLMHADPLAILGMGCRLPGGVKTPDAFWDLLQDGVDAVGPIPEDRWPGQFFYGPEAKALDHGAAAEGAFLDGKTIREFDPAFFGIAPREATSMDPQQRLFLEVSWEALENAGIAPAGLANSRTGVFTGACWSDYAHLALDRDIEEIDAYLATGNHHSMIPGRLSYILGLQGPSIAVDTACSSSLVAVHLACQNLRDETCDLAIAGGVNLFFLPQYFVNLGKAGMLSANGRCKTFSAEADGFGRGEGCGVIVLKRLVDAVADRDSILAVIRGSAVNQDGPSSGLTVPNGVAQRQVIREALRRAGVMPEQVSYVEAHGTGTQLGDPIEVGALAEIYGEGKNESRPLYLGSVKTNIGHLEGAAGIAGLLKVVLSLKNKQLPPHLHFKRPNPHIDWENLPLSIPVSSVSWEPHLDRRIAGVSSFGFSGTNAHLLLEEAPLLPDSKNDVDRPCHLMTLSAKCKPALVAQAGRCASYLASNSGLDTADVTHTLNTGRSHFNFRLGLVAGSTADIQEAMAAFALGDDHSAVVSGLVNDGKRAPITFLFGGQGSQYAGMGRELYRTQPLFREAIDDCAERLKSHMSRPLQEVLFADDRQPSIIDDTQFSQPCLFAVQWALVRLWSSWGIEPEAVLGHSVGQYTAACTAGVFSLADGLKLIAHRAGLMSGLPKGGQMIQVIGDLNEVKEILSSHNDIDFAAFNGPNITTLSAPGKAMEAASVDLKARGLRVTHLSVSHAFHSRLMEPVLGDFLKIAQEVTFAKPTLMLISNLSGLPAGDEICDPEYWVRHIREPVQFFRGVEYLQQNGDQIFLEIGPKPSLLPLVRRSLPAGDHVLLPSMRPGQSWQTLNSSLLELYIRGADINWQGYDRGFQRTRTPLPTYPFQRQPYWVPEPSGTRLHVAEDLTRGQPIHPLLGRPVFFASETVQYETQIGSDRPAYLRDHGIDNTPIMPAAVYLEMALAAAKETFGTDCPLLQDVAFLRALPLEDGERYTLHFLLEPPSDGVADFRIMRLQPQPKQKPNWICHMSGKVHSQEAASSTMVVDIDALHREITEELNVDDFYSRCLKRRLHYGPHFQALLSLRRSTNASMGQVAIPSHLACEIEGYLLHPVLLDACLQVLLAAFPEGMEESSYLPIGLERLTLFRKPSQSTWCHARTRPFSADDADLIIADLVLHDDEGNVVARVEGLAMKQTEIDRLLTLPSEEMWHQWLYEPNWTCEKMMVGEIAADFFLDPEALQEGLSSPLTEYLARTGHQNAATLLNELDDLCVDYIFQALNRLGFKPQIGDGFTTTQVATSLKVVDAQRPPLGRLLQVLGDAGVLAEDGDRWKVIRVPELTDPNDGLRAIRSRFPQAETELLVFGRCAAHLDQVLGGQSDAVQLLFPEADLTAATQFYEEAPTFRPMNVMVRRAVSAVLGNLPADRPLRILEIGAGTGGTTAHILPELSPHQSEYVFTDLSPLFTLKAQERFKNYEFVQYRRLDIERDPIAQGYESHSFDLVFAANVVHATRDLTQTLKHVLRLLVPGGMLMLLEGTTRQRWIDLTFGMTEGWWRFRDFRKEQGYPLLSSHQWRDLMASCGFESSAALPSEPELQDSLFPQAILMGKAPAVVNRETDSGHWLVFTDQRGTGENVVAELEERGAHCTRVTRAKAYAHTSANTFVLDPTEADHYGKLLKAVRDESGLTLRGVIHLWSLDGSDQSLLNCENLDQLQHLGCFSILHLIRALTAAAMTPRLCLVTRGAQPVVPKDSVPSLAQAGIWGLGRVIAVEHPELQCVRFDLDPHAPPDQMGPMVHKLLDGTDEDQVAIRDGQSHILRLNRATAPRLQAAPIRFGNDQSYLIVGGLGGLGLLVAAWMVERGARYLVLVGRSKTDEAALQRIRSFEAAGAQVMTQQVDVADPSQVDGLMAAIDEKMPQLTGVIQSAGVLDDGMILQMTATRFRRVMAPKVLGSWNLHMATKNRNLDFFILFSSIASLLGTPGQANHAASNAFMDALAFARRQMGLPGTSVNWGAWGEIGAVVEAQVTDSLAKKGIRIIDPDLGLATLEEIFRRNCVQIGVAHIDWPQWTRLAASPYFTEFKTGKKVTAASESDFVDKWLKLAVEERYDVLVASIENQVMVVLGMTRNQELDRKQGFFKLGMDSLTSLELRNRLQAHFKLSLDTTVALNYPTVDALTAHLLERLDSGGQPSGEQPEPPTQTEKSETPALSSEALDGLSEDELSQLLEQKLENLD